MPRGRSRGRGSGRSVVRSRHKLNLDPPWRASESARTDRLPGPIRRSGDDGRIDVLIFHGYLLRGTGSNVYTANVAQALSRLGHRVHLLCQDRRVDELEWIDAVGRWRGGRLGTEPTGHRSSPAPGSGSITAYLPEIGEILPVYVEDPYDGFDARAFPRLSDRELDRYIDANVGAIDDVVAAAGGIDLALANHLVMGPLIVARSGLPYAAKVHGSALSYTVIGDSRFLPYAKEGLAGAGAVLVGSRHTAESLWETLAEPEVEAKTRLGPPGVEIDRFAAAGPMSTSGGTRTIAPTASTSVPAGDRVAAPAAPDPAGLLHSLAGRLASEQDERVGAAAFGRDPAAAAAAIGAYADAAGPRVLFVGKLIVSKGCDLLLAAWPLLAGRRPGAHLLIGGFGAFREPLERLWGALCSADLGAAREIAERGRELEGGEPGPLPILAEFLREPPPGYLEAARRAAGSVSFSGRLEHDEVADLCRGSEAMVVPSTFPEAFGMVAAEAAAAGALPVCARHSGLEEVAAVLDAELPPSARGLTSFELDAGAVAAIAERLDRWIGLEPADRRAAEEALAATVARLWSWEGVARGVLDAAAGQLDELPAIPGSDVSE